MLAFNHYTRCLLSCCVTYSDEDTLARQLVQVRDVAVKPRSDTRHLGQRAVAR